MRCDEVSERFGFAYREIARLVAALHHAEGCTRETVRDTEGTLEALEEAKRMAESLTESLVEIDKLTEGEGVSS